MLSYFRSALSHTKIDFMKVQKLALIASVVCMLLSVGLVFAKGLNFGIDFAGGILIEARMQENIDVAAMRELLSGEAKDVQIQNIDEKDVLIRVAKSDVEQSV